MWRLDDRNGNIKSLEMRIVSQSKGQASLRKHLGGTHRVHK